MAEKSPRYEKKRVPLHKFIPLKTPLALHIDVSSICNFQCSFCANHSPAYTGNKQRKYEVMNYNLFTKIIDDLNEFCSSIKSLRLYNIGEPLLNKRLPDMVYYAHKSGCVEIIDTTTNGSLLTPDISLALIDAGLDKICFSIESMTSQGYKDVANASVDFNTLVKNIAFFYEHSKQCHVHVKIINESVPTEEDQQAFYTLFADKCHSMWIDSVVNVWPDFNIPNATSGKNMYNERIIPLLVCPQPFYNLSVNPDGIVTHCDLDWRNEFIIGDLTRQSLKEIWDSDLVYYTQLTHLKGERKNIGICAKCPWPDNGCIDNFDIHREAVLERFINMNGCRGITDTFNKINNNGKV